jgi:hypothetical protein
LWQFPSGGAIHWTSFTDAHSICFSNMSPLFHLLIVIHRYVPLECCSNFICIRQIIVDIHIGTNINFTLYMCSLRTLDG